MGLSDLWSLYASNGHLWDQISKSEIRNYFSCQWTIWQIYWYLLQTKEKREWKMDWFGHWWSFYILHFGSSIIHGSIWNTWSSFVVMVQQYEYILVWGFERQLPNAYLKRSWSFKMLDVKINKILILLLQLKQLSEACCPKIIVDSWLKYNQTVPSWSKAKD